MKRAAAAICFLLLATQSFLAQRSPQLTPAEILTRVSSTYVSCRSYSDEGETSVLTGAGPATSRPVMEHFSTVFVRPDAFRFEFQVGPAQYNLRYIAWKSGELEKKFLPSQSATPDDLREVLMGMFLPSSGAALTVPALLMSDSFQGKGLLASLTDLKFGREEKMEGRRVFKIEARLENDPFTLWIDADQFLILQVEQIIRFNHLIQHTSTRYHPVLNAEIAADRLAFNAPGIVQPDTAPLAAPVRAAPELKSKVRPRLKNFGDSAFLSGDQIEKLLAQRQRQTDDEDVVRVNTDMVVCDVLVVDRQGRTIQGLGAEDFIIKEDDQPQEIGSFSLGNSDQVPRSIVLIIDYSNSQLPYVITSVEAAKKLVDQLKPRDRMALVTDDVQVLVDFTGDKEVLKQQLDNLKQRAMSGWLGRSKQYDALMATLTELFTREEEWPIVIFQTDGDQLDALGKEMPAFLRPYAPPKKFGFEDLLTAAERARATIYSIIPGVDMAGYSGEELLERSRRDWENRMKMQQELSRLRNLPVTQTIPPSDEFLRINAARWARLHTGVVQIARATGGWADYLETPGQADALYAHVLSDINQRYVLAYYPRNRARDGQRRKVRIEVRGHPEYIVLGRKSYFAPLP